ncbi:MAG: KAP family NTPase [Oscillospiraceae bacterium]|nr:KAP family NTPase [Oscillospiraceae bacterium]
MAYEKLNFFIKNYIENDKTGRAVMLTSGWGTGKSYYINSNLKPFLESSEGGKHNCVIVSLYGLTNISDISKSIYFELRTVGKSDNTEVKSTGKVVAKIVGKTIFNGIINKIGFDISSVDDDLQEIYNSIDLSRKLIVLDDFERSGIDRVELLGYINNLCEQDSVKVLII